MTCGNSGSGRRWSACSARSGWTPPRRQLREDLDRRARRRREPLGGRPAPPHRRQALRPVQHPGGAGGLSGPPGVRHGPGRRGPGDPSGGDGKAAGAHSGPGGGHPHPHRRPLPAGHASAGGQPLRQRRPLQRGAGLPAQAPGPPGGRRLSPVKSREAAQPLAVPLLFGLTSPRGELPSPPADPGGSAGCGGSPGHRPRC